MLDISVARRARRGGLVILGISAGYHDSACCALRDGSLVAAAQEERFTRVKHDRSFPRHAIRFCLAQAGLSIADIDVVSYYEDPVAKLGRQIWSTMMPGLSDARLADVEARMAAPLPQDVIRTVLGSSAARSTRSDDRCTSIREVAGIACFF